MLKSKENSLWLLLLCTVAAWSAEAPFRRGVNLTNWLQAPSAQNVHFAKFGRADFAQIQQLGCDVVRLPINLHAMTSGPPDYRIDPLLYDLLDQIADWADELGLHLILDNHTFDPAVSTSPDIGDVLVPVWTQLAAHFAAHPAQLYYEILNEPHGISDAAWNAIQQQVIDAIRQVDQQHAIVVGPSNWNSFRNLQRMPVFADDNLVYTFHFYEPFVFTHQGASWSNPSLVPLRGVPFPYERARMPALPPSLQGTWGRHGVGQLQPRGHHHAGAHTDRRGRGLSEGSRRAAVLRGVWGVQPQQRQQRPHLVVRGGAAAHGGAGHRVDHLGLPRWFWPV